MHNRYACTHHALLFTLHFFCAEVAELADALGSGSSGRKAVRVRVPPSAFLFSRLFNKLPVMNPLKRSLFDEAISKMFFFIPASSSLKNPKTTIITLEKAVKTTY